MKYRRLTLDELKDFEKEFVAYLIMNGIDAAEWTRVKDKDTSKADAILDEFSDSIFEGILTKVDHIAYSEDRALHLYHLGDTEASVLAVTTMDHKILDLALILTDETYQRTLHITLSSEKYNGSRSQSIFDRMESGAFIVMPGIFDKFRSLMALSN